MDGGFAIRLVLGLAAIGIVLATLRWTLPLLLRNGPTPAGRRIQIVESTLLSSNTAIHIVRVNGRVLLLGGGGGHVQLLAELTDSAGARPPAETKTPNGLPHEAPDSR